MDNTGKIQQYAIQVRPLRKEDGGGFEAHYPQLARSVVGYGATPQEAVSDLCDAVPVFLEAIAALGQSLPTPEWAALQDAA